MRVCSNASICVKVGRHSEESDVASFTLNCNKHPPRSGRVIGADVGLYSVTVSTISSLETRGPRRLVASMAIVSSDGGMTSVWM